MFNALSHVNGKPQKPLIHAAIAGPPFVHVRLPVFIGMNGTVIVVALWAVTHIHSSVCEACIRRAMGARGYARVRMMCSDYVNYKVCLHRGSRLDAERSV